MIEKGEFQDEAEKFWDLEEDYEDADHEMIEKSEHHVVEQEVHDLPKDVWKPAFHGDDPRHHYEHFEGEDEMEGHSFNHHYEHEDGIDPKYLDRESKGMLTPKTPSKDDPRLMIPKGKANPEHDHLIVPKEPEYLSDEDRYGQAYEHERKAALKGSHESAGLTPKAPISERKVQPTGPHKDRFVRKPCSTYGSDNKCEGMTCESDD